MIQFFHNDFLTLDNKQLSEWLVKVANKEGFVIQKLYYNFVDARKLYELNHKYLNHHNDTDILTNLL